MPLRKGKSQKTISKNIETELYSLRYDFSIKKNINNTFQISLHNFNHIQNIILYLDTLHTITIDRHGWFPSKMDIIDWCGSKNKMSYNEEYLIEKIEYFEDVTITYESKFDIEKNIPKFLYHISIREFEYSVLKNGLIPKSKSKLSTHLDRIYMCLDINSCKNLINEMKSSYISRYIKNRKNKINTKWIIYEIDTNGLNLKLYKDPNYIDGYYSVDNIPKENIKIIDAEK